MTKFVIHKGRKIDFNAAWARMDAGLRERAWSITSDAQSCFDNYLEAHAEKFGGDFPARSDLAAEYVELVGYDPFEDDPAIGEHVVAETLAEWKATREKAQS